MTKISDETNINRIEHKSKKNIVLGTIFGYLSVLVSIVSGIILTPWIIDNIGKPEYGLYGLATSLISLFLLDLGLSTTTNTYLAKLRAKGDKDGVQRFLAAIFKIYLTLDIIFILIIAGLYFAAPVIYQYSYQPHEIQTLQYLLLIVGGYSLISFPSTCFIGVISTYEKFSMNKLIDLIQKIVYFVLTIVAIKLNWGVIGITAVNVGSGLLAVLIRFIYMITYLNVKLDLRLRVTRDELKSIFVFSSWSLVYAVCFRLIFNITPSILGIVSTPDEIALFTIVTTVEGYIYTFGAMTSTFFLAKVARTDQSGNEDEVREHIQALASKIGKIQFVVIACIMIGFISVGQEFISIWFNGDQSFGPVYYCIVILCTSEIFAIPQIIFNSSMYTHGYIRQIAINSIVKAAINLGLSFWLSSIYGALGASIAIGVAGVVSLILDNIAYRRCLKVSLLRFFKSIYIRGGITIVISLGIGLVAHFFMPIDDIKVKFVVDGFIFIIAYILCTLLITFTKEERRYYVDSLLTLMHIKRRKKVEESENNEEEKEDSSENKEQEDDKKEENEQN